MLEPVARAFTARGAAAPGTTATAPAPRPAGTGLSAGSVAAPTTPRGSSGRSAARCGSSASAPAAWSPSSRPRPTPSPTSLGVAAWEPPVDTALEDGAELHARIPAPVEAHLSGRPGGRRARSRCCRTGYPAAGRTWCSPDAAAWMRNAEAAVRDDGPVITRHAFPPGSLPGRGRPRGQPLDAGGARRARLEPINAAG